MACPVGRNFNPDHATCRSCPLDCRERHTTRPSSQKPVEPVRVAVIGNKLVTNQYLSSLNAWNNKPRYLYSKEKKKWEKVLAGAVYIWGLAEGKRALTVMRFVESRRNLIKDFDNRVGALKPVKDVLVATGVLVDDSDEYLEFTVDQDVDPGNPRTEIVLL